MSQSQLEEPLHRHRIFREWEIGAVHPLKWHGLENGKDIVVGVGVAGPPQAMTMVSVTLGQFAKPTEGLRYLMNPKVSPIRAGNLLRLGSHGDKAARPLKTCP